MRRFLNPVQVVAVFAGLFLWAVPAFAGTPAGDIADARAKLDRLSSYHVSVENASGAIEIDFAPPQSIRVRTGGSETLIAGDGVYVNGGDGWTVSALNPTLLILLTTLQQDRFLAVADGETVTDKGIEVVGGMPLHRYEIQTPTNAGDLHRSVWISGKTGLPYRVARVSEGGTMTTTYSLFNKDFGITAPLKAQSGTQPMGGMRGY